MLTRHGWLVVGGAAALLAAGRTFGILELFILGAAAAALVVFSAGFVALTRLRLAVARTLAPPRVYAGSPSRVELSVRNDAGRSTPVLRLFDPVTGTRGAELLLSPLRPATIAQAAYRLPTDKRGVIAVGPLEIIVGDPFGLAATSTIAAPVAEVTVFPRIDAIVPVPHSSGFDPHAGAEHPSALGRTGEDFYALREYVVGDDLRRVHWKATARHDELMVRQDELPWQGRVSVLLDVRRSTHSAESLELAVSAAASIVTACWQRRDLVRLATTDGVDLGFAAGTAHVEAIMEHLAVVPACPGGTLRGMVDAMSTQASSGSLVVVVANIPPTELATLVNQRGRFDAVTVVQFDRTSWDPASPPGQRTAAKNIVRVDREQNFAAAWNRAMHPRTRAAASAAAATGRSS